MAGRTALITLDGIVLRVARDPQTGAPLWRRERAPATADDLIPFRETVSFGYLGLGGSDPSLRGCYDYALDVDSETWDVLAPGPARGTLGLSLPQAVLAMASVRASDAQSLTFSTPTGSDEGTSWTSPGNIATSDNLYATTTSGASPTSWLRATNWNVSGVGQVLGIQVDVEGNTTTAGNTAPLELQLLNGSGTPVGNVKTITLTNTEGYLSAGGPSDLWGSTINSTDLASSSFGVRLRVGATPDSQYASSVVSGGGWTSPLFATGAIDGQLAYYNAPAPGFTGYIILGYSFSAGAYTGDVTVAARMNWQGSSTKQVYFRVYESGTLKATSTAITVNPNTWLDASYTFSNLSFSNLANLRIEVYGYNDESVTRTMYLDAVRVQAGAQNIGVSVDHVRLTVITGAAARKLYAGGGNRLAKVDLGNLIVDDVKTFTHNEVGHVARVTDVVAVKDGADPFGAAPQGIGGPVVVVAFGQTAQLQQINTVKSSGADTYGTLSGTKAFASALAVTMSPDNTQVLLWRAGPVGSGVNSFSSLKNVAVGTTTVDVTSDGAWSPTTGYQMGDIAESITGMAEYARGLVVGKPSGVYTVDDRFSPFLLFGTRAYRHEDNCRRLLAWGTKLVIPTTQDLAAIPGGQDPFIGLSRLVSNRSPVRGYPTAVAGHGRYLYAAFYDGTDSWVCRGRLSQGEVPWPVVWHSLFRVPNYKIQAMHVTDDGQNGPVRLFWAAPGASAGTHDVGYLVLDRRGSTAAPTYQSGGVMYSQRFGVMTKRTVLRRVHAYGQGCSATSYWTIEVAFDDGPWQLVGHVQQNGPVTFDLSPPLTGTVGQLRFTCTLGAATDRPLLLGTTSEQAGPGGVVVEGFRQADEVERFEIHVRLGREALVGPAARQTRTPAKVLADLQSRQGRPVSLVAEDLFGDRTARTVVVQAVAEQPTAQAGDLPAERTLVLRGYVLN